MASLRSILNPEDLTRRDGETSVSPTTPDSAASPSSAGYDAIHCDDHEHGSGAVVQRWKFPDHAAHPNCPDTLDCLPNTESDERPQHTLPVILRCAILGSPRKRLTIREIYASMEAKYPFYRTAGPTWKQSVRHHLSLNRLFERQPRPVTDPGFGSYWTVNLLAPPGTKRPRKRGRPKDKSDGLLGPGQTPTQDKKAARAARSTPYASPTQEECDEDAQGTDEDDFESEEDQAAMMQLDSARDRPLLPRLGVAHQQRPIMNGPPMPPPPPTYLPPSQGQSPSSYVSDSNSPVDRLQSEITSLRRQAAEAVSLSVRLTDQLSQAQAEAARSKNHMHTVEQLLEEETRKRRQAERDADDEAARRRSLEEQLEDLRMRWPSASSINAHN
ncbi:hypothetical protein CYLTODRAFT_386747 [Cylindrobasidium torrendii FP15055 ss-10]|uniref:Fork-head domain-containing protein n=1 Tax=Cylindrobasidium torrendii FP15055 ss-10 TaxID=1314674 RepID=A0A0D7BT19_9AGAR|nr:hypothetical protein CYLTODRAFT_386747 [Cylindrobasidium torrendii FP15055 ss-10]